MTMSASKFALVKDRMEEEEETATSAKFGLARKVPAVSPPPSPKDVFVKVGRGRRPEAIDGMDKRGRVPSE